MEEKDVKAIAIKWLDDGPNALAMKRYDLLLQRHSDWESDVRSQGKDPARQKRDAVFMGRRQATAELIDVYLTDWLDNHGLPIAYTVRQEVFTMAHRLLTGQEKIED
ncbi:hypothetical protein AB0C33_02005 [Nonomuraea sp. NPDC048881]|uniref:hypothetical protein n=1 Tax=Nonomuraea sp. NPDC048881 TaxID=3155030 RepID=UPI0033DA372F